MYLKNILRFWFFETARQMHSNSRNLDFIPQLAVTRREYFVIIPDSSYGIRTRCLVLVSARPITRFSRKRSEILFRAHCKHFFFQARILLKKAILNLIL